MYNLVASPCYDGPAGGPRTETCWTNLKQYNLTQLVLVSYQIVSGSLTFV